MEFSEKRILITGATRGLGKAIAFAFAREGAWVCINYHTDEEAASATKHQIKALTDKHMIFKADITDRAQVEGMVSHVLEQWGFVDILVNNAGIIKDKMLIFMDETDWDKVLDTNLKGGYLCSKAVIKSMIGRRYGRIINMASPSAVTGRAGQTNYSASKGGIISFTKSLSKETARLGITVNAVCPGVINTPMTETLAPETKKDFLNMIPMGRFGNPEDIAHAVLFLASDRAAYITGQVLAVDGGLV
ncbi:MAG: 3-oxoacyl-[acyl-carrier-protein] reductase [Deltaproteobacteria bacterium]|nr:3-oxoacyl-[acyl-carrier-protein] reductase [Deltaproteobacteria bacterium]